jgi:hypothetical protein
MLDGLDEMASKEERALATAWVDQQMARFPDVRFVLTSRPHGYFERECQYVEVILEVQPLTYDEVRRFVDNWFMFNEARRQGQSDAGVLVKAAGDSKRIMAEIEKSAALSELAVNPLLLTMITTVLDSQGIAPDSKVGIYKEICEVTLFRRERAKGLKTDATQAGAMSASKKQLLLQRLALEMMKRGLRACDLRTATAVLEGEFAKVGAKTVNVQGFLNDICERSGLLVERELGQYEFCHKSIQEYFAATEIKDTRQVGLLLLHLAEPWWDETIRLYAAQSDTGPIIKAALLDPSLPKLSLALECLKEGLSTPVELREALVLKLDAGLEGEEGIGARFLGADARLSERLQGLMMGPADVSFDQTPITCIEYALFVAENPGTAPPSWQGDRFPSGTALMPARGISLKAAVAFCEWLSRRAPIGKCLRLPTLEEARASKVDWEGTSYWVTDQSYDKPFLYPSPILPALVRIVRAKGHREWVDVFEEFVNLKKTCGESTVGLTYEKFADKLRVNENMLLAKHRARRVKFATYVKDGRAALKATPIRD